MFLETITYCNSWVDWELNWELGDGSVPHVFLKIWYQYQPVDSQTLFRQQVMASPRWQIPREGKRETPKVLSFFLVCWWFGTLLWFSHILGMIFPTDHHIFQRGRSTTNQLINKPLLIFLFVGCFLIKLMGWWCLTIRPSVCKAAPGGCSGNVHETNLKPRGRLREKF